MLRQIGEHEPVPRLPPAQRWLLFAARPLRRIGGRLRRGCGACRIPARVVGIRRESGKGRRGLGGNLARAVGIRQDSGRNLAGTARICGHSGKNRPFLARIARFRQEIGGNLARAVGIRQDSGGIPARAARFRQGSRRGRRGSGGEGVPSMEHEVRPVRHPDVLDADSGGGAEVPDPGDARGERLDVARLVEGLGYERVAGERGRLTPDRWS